MENIVYNELLIRGYNVDVGIVDVFAKNKNVLNFIGRAVALAIRKVFGSFLRR